MEQQVQTFGCDWCKGSFEGMPVPAPSVVNGMTLKKTFPLPDKEVQAHFRKRLKDYKPVKHVSSNKTEMEFCCRKCKQEYIDSTKRVHWANTEVT